MASAKSSRKALAGRERAGARRADGPRRDRQILETAIRLFHQSGYANTSIEDVASAVGMVKGSLYYYIDGKEDLLFRILADVHDGVRAIMESLDEREDLGPLARLAAYVRAQALFNADHLEEIAIYHHEFARLSGDRLTEILRRRQESLRWVAAQLEEAERRGEVREPLDPELAATTVFAPLNWMYVWFRPDGDLSAEALGDYFAEYVLHGLTGAPAGAGTPAP